jgi:hypothetical protein
MFTGAKVEIEPAGMMLQSSHRPDLVVHAGRNSPDGIIDVRTALAALQGSCLGAAATAGHAAAQAASAKELKWHPQAQAQGLRFFAFVIEDGGFLGGGARGFSDFIAARMGGSIAKRNAFITYAVQSVRVVSMKAVCDILLDRAPMGAIPRVPRRTFLPLGQPKGQPAVTQPRVIPRGAPAQGAAFLPDGGCARTDGPPCVYKPAVCGYEGWWISPWWCSTPKTSAVTRKTRAWFVGRVDIACLASCRLECRAGRCVV